MYMYVNCTDLDGFPDGFVSPLEYVYLEFDGFVSPDMYSQYM